MVENPRNVRSPIASFLVQVKGFKFSDASISQFSTLKQRFYSKFSEVANADLNYISSIENLPDDSNKR